MSITVNLYYTGTGRNARSFADLREKYKLRLRVERYVDEIEK